MLLYIHNLYFLRNRLSTTWSFCLCIYSKFEKLDYCILYKLNYFKSAYTYWVNCGVWGCLSKVSVGERKRECIVCFVRQRGFILSSCGSCLSNLFVSVLVFPKFLSCLCVRIVVGWKGCVVGFVGVLFVL